jgi:hypothetical protein
MMHLYLQQEWLQLLHSDRELPIGMVLLSQRLHKENGVCSVQLVPRMSDHSDEYEFTEFTEDELRSIDSTAEQFLGGVWPPSSPVPQPATRLGK